MILIEEMFLQRKKKFRKPDIKYEPSIFAIKFITVQIFFFF